MSEAIGIEQTIAPTTEIGNSQALNSMPIMVPTFYASVIQVASTSNEAVLGFGCTRPANATGATPLGSILVQVPVCNVSVSPQTAKDLARILNTFVVDYEKEFGEIATAYTIAEAGKL